MNEFQFIPIFIPRDTKLHHLGVMAKLLLILLYAIGILFSRRGETVLLYLLVLIFAHLVFRLPLRQKKYIGFILLLVSGVVVFGAQIPAYLGTLMLVFGKIAALTLALGLFSMSTRINDLLKLQTRLGKLPAFLNPLYYLVNTTFAVLPSVQYDFQRAIEAEEARRGKKVRFYSFASLVNVVILLIVRTINRSTRFTQTVIDRGYSLQTGLSPLQAEPIFSWSNLLIAVIGALPAIAVYILMEL